MLVEVNTVIRPRPFDTIIKFQGTTVVDEIVTFGVDHRPARSLYEAMVAAKQTNQRPILVEVESWQILSVVTPGVESEEE